MDIPPKLRVMCSYGGQIVPRPRTKSLCYAGGETRIVSLNPTSVTNLSSLVSHLSSSLKIPTPFALKYQLPNHDLDSLISVLTDEDLLILLEELQPLDLSTVSRSVSSSSSSSSSSNQSRIRLFVFAAARSPETKEEEEQKSAPPHPSSMMQHPKTEAWFHDALKGAKIMQKGRNCGGLGFEGEAAGGLGGEDSVGNGNGVGSTSVAESMMLETTSSFGSTSSSASLTNLAPVKSNSDDTGIGLQDSIVKLNTSDAITSGYSASATSSYLQSDAYKDPANPIFVTSIDTKVIPNRTESENRESDVTMQMHNTVIQQQKVQYIQVESPYMSQNYSGLMPMSSFYPYYHTQLPQQQMMQYQYQSNQPQPVYLYPVAPTQTYSLPGYTGYIENPAMTSDQVPLHANTSYMAPKGLQTKPTQIDALSNTPQVYNTAHMAIPTVAAPVSHVPYTESQQQVLGLSEKLHQAQSVADAFREPVKDSNELDDDLARVQIYKSQPPPPSCYPQYQTVTKETEVLLSEALDQLHTDSLKQQVRTTQPQ